MKIGFIDYYLDEWHANKYPAWIEEASGGEMKVTLAYALIDGPDGRRTTDQWCADMGIAKAESIEQVIEECDAIVVLSPDNCEMHEQLCQLPLRSKKPVYVDKTFAPDYETAKRIFDIAEESGTPCYSTSALRFATEYEGIENVRAISSWGPNDFEIYSIHQLEPIMMLMKADPRRVMYLPGDSDPDITVSTAHSSLSVYADWVVQLKKEYTFTADNALDIILQETGKVFAAVLEDAGVYKNTEDGRAAFLRFVEKVNGEGER